MSHSLVVRAGAVSSMEPAAGSSLTRVREVLDSLATRDVNGDVLTAVRTTGRGKDDRTHRPNRSLKEVLALPLTPRFRELLQGREEACSRR